MHETILSGDRAAEVGALFRKPQWYLQGRNYHVRTRMRIVREMLGNSRFEQVLDIGCGDGSISLPLLGPGTNLLLLDMSEEMLAIARSQVPERFKGQVKTLNGNFLQLELDAEGYDAILCLGVLAYVDSAKPLIEKLARLLRPGGRLLLECTDNAHFVSSLLRVYGRLAQPLVSSKIRTTLHSRAEVLSACRSAGLQLAGMYRYCSPPPVLRRMLSQRFHNRVIRGIFGSTTRNRASWLGNECIFNLARAIPFGSR
jgi:2-polyprenyl-3-methyl-5-hydroxy-6-metoxy-1,4-benzoquinol methylase